MQVTLPHTFHDGVGEQASGAQVMENLQALATILQRFSYGAVGPAGEITLAGSGDWTVAHLSTGLYEVRYSTEHVQTPALVATCDVGGTGPLPYVATVYGSSKSTGVVRIFDPVTRAQTDMGFSFVAIG
jgi:hypothetical protein